MDVHAGKTYTYILSYIILNDIAVYFHILPGVVKGFARNSLVLKHYCP